jgi:hypothetical protein
VKKLKSECVHCGSTAKCKLYWSSHNLLKVPLKTNFCDKCARHMLIGQKPIVESKPADKEQLEMAT